MRPSVDSTVKEFHMTDVLRVALGHGYYNYLTRIADSYDTLSIQADSSRNIMTHTEL